MRVSVPGLHGYSSHVRIVTKRYRLFSLNKNNRKSPTAAETSAAKSFENLRRRARVVNFAAKTEKSLPPSPCSLFRANAFSPVKKSAPYLKFFLFCSEHSDITSLRNVREIRSLPKPSASDYLFYVMPRKYDRFKDLCTLKKYKYTLNYEYIYIR